MKKRRFNPRTENWQDVFGGGMTASEVLTKASHPDVLAVAVWLLAEYIELYGKTRPRAPEEFLAMAKQIMSEVA